MKLVVHHQSLLLGLLLSFLFLFSLSSACQAAVITATSLSFTPATDSEKIIFPAQVLTYRGEQVVGVNSSVGCGEDDSVGVFKPTGYFQLNFSTPIMYMYRVYIRTYSPRILASSSWLWWLEGGHASEDPALYSEYFPILLDTTPSPNGDFVSEGTVCMHIAASSTINNSIRVYAREPGVLFQQINLTMLAPPKIIRAFSICTDGECDLSQDLPIRVISTSLCFAVDLDAEYGNFIINGPNNRQHTCISRGNVQISQVDGSSYVDCLVPANFTQGSADLTVSLLWPVYDQMPAADSNIPISISQKKGEILWVIAPAAVGAIALILAARYFYKKWAATRNAPRNADKFSAMFVNARNVTLLWEKAPVNAADALKLYDLIVRKASNEFGCYVAKKIGDSYLIVAKELNDNFSAAAQIQRELGKINWCKILTGSDVPQEIVLASKKKHQNMDQLRKMKKQQQKTASNQNNNNDSKNNSSGNNNNNSNNNNNNSFQQTRISTYRSIDEEADITWSHSSIKSKTSNTGLAQPESPITAEGSAKFSSGSNGNLRRQQQQQQVSSSDPDNTNCSARTGSASSHRTANVIDNGVQCSIAITVGKGRIVSHEAGTLSEYETFEYSGDVVDNAAEIIDLAHPCQVITTEFVQNAVTSSSSSSSIDGTFTDLETKMVKGQNVKYVQFNPTGLEVLSRGLQQESENSDSLQAQLEAAASGFSQKVCTLLYVEFAGVLKQATGEIDRKIFLEKYKDLYKPINEFIRQLGGTLININATNLVVAFNAFSPSPMHVTRAATCYFRLREIFAQEKIRKQFSAEKNFGFCAGLATGLCIIGSLEADKSHKQIFGDAWEQSQELMRLARSYTKHSSSSSSSYSLLTCPCLAVWNARSDLNHNTQFQFVDLALVNKPGANNNNNNNLNNNNHNFSVIDLMGGTASAGAPAPAPAPRSIRGIVALVPSDERNQDEDREWMYDLEQQQINNPYFETNEAFVWILGDFVNDALERWNTLLKEKLAKNKENEVEVKQMVGLKKLAEIFGDNCEQHEYEGAFERYISKMEVNERL